MGTRAHLQLQGLIHVIKQDFAEITSVRKVVLEYELASERDVSPEFVPFV